MRRCPCPCSRPVDPSSQSKYAEPSICRPRYWKIRNAGLDKRGEKRARDRAAKKIARADGRIKSDDRLSFERAVTVLTDYLCTRWPEDLGPAVEELLELEAREVLARARPRREP